MNNKQLLMNYYYPIYKRSIKRLLLYFFLQLQLQFHFKISTILVSDRRITRISISNKKFVLYYAKKARIIPFFLLVSE